MPAIVLLTIFLVYYFWTWSANIAVQESANLMMYWLPLMLVWLVLWILFQRQIIFSFSGAEPIERKDYPEIYNIVENLCITRGVPMPKIWIIPDHSMNAFATWWSKDNSWIVFSQWILEKLDKKEIEAVAGHELTHILNEDIKLMVVSTVFIWFIWTIWEILMRSWSTSRDSKESNPLPLIWFALYLVSLIILPLINLAISRKREFLADAWSVELLWDNRPMINALLKISQDPVIETIEKDNIAAMCIANPIPKKEWFFSKVKNLFSTHPSIEERVKLLQKY